MTPVLLDTNAFAMVLTGDARLPTLAKDTILEASSTSVSAITFYEIGQKVRLGKWDAMAPFVEKLVDIGMADGFELISLNPTIAMTATLLEWSHRDPFDRMIAATAMSAGLRLVSSDRAFDQLDGVIRIWK